MVYYSATNSRDSWLGWGLLSIIVVASTWICIWFYTASPDGMKSSEELRESFEKQIDIKEESINKLKKYYSLEKYYTPKNKQGLFLTTCLILFLAILLYIGLLWLYDTDLNKDNSNLWPYVWLFVLILLILGVFWLLMAIIFFLFYSLGRLNAYELNAYERSSTSGKLIFRRLLFVGNLSVLVSLVSVVYQFAESDWNIRTEHGKHLILYVVLMFIGPNFSLISAYSTNKHGLNKLQEGNTANPGRSPKLAWWFPATWVINKVRKGARGQKEKYENQIEKLINELRKLKLTDKLIRLFKTRN